MIDVSQFTSVASLAVLITILVQLVKPYVRSSKLVPLVAVAMGMGLAVLIQATTGQVHSYGDVIADAIGGLVAALIAIGGYESSLDKIKTGSAKLPK